MLAVLSGLGAVQYRSDGREADELLAAVCHAFEGTEPIVIRSDDKHLARRVAGVDLGE